MKTNRTIRSVVAGSLFATALACPQLLFATIFQWNVASPSANNWNVNANWNPGTGNPGVGDTAIFNAIGTSPNSTTVNNVVSVNTTVASLVYTNVISGQWHVTQIPAGVTLTVTGGVTVGGTGAVDGLITAAAMTDGGTLLVTGGNYIVGNTGSSQFLNNTNDLSALSNFVYSVNAGFFNFGASNRSGGTITLAGGSNSITAGTMNIGTGSTSSSGTSRMQLGAGTNIINISAVNMGFGRETANLQFFTGTGGWRLRGTGGTDSDRCTLVGGDRNTGGTGAPTPQVTTANILANGHPVDLKFSTLTLGRMTRTQSGTDGGYYQGVGNFQFDQGVVDATTVNLAVCSGNSTNSVGLGTVTVGASGTLLAGNMSMANITATAADASGVGTLNVFGGTATVTGNISKTTLKGTGVVAVASSGVLYTQGKIGTPAIPLDVLNVTNATLRFNVDASGPITTNASVLTVNASGVTTIDIAQVVGVGGPTTIPLISYATLNGTVAGNFAVTAPGGYFYSLVDNAAQKRIDLSITPSVIIVPLIWTGVNNSDWDLTTSNWTSAGVTTNYADNTVTVFDDTASTFDVVLTGTLSPASMTMSNSGTYVLHGPGSLAGTNSLILKGTGTTILDNVAGNSYTGGTIIGVGTLQIGANDANGNIPGGTPVTDNSVLVYARTDNVTNSGPISGVGRLAQSGSATLTLAGGNSYNTTTINSGALQVGAGGTSGTLGTGNVTNNSALSFNRSDNLTAANVITGTGSVTKNGAGTLTFSGTNNFSGGLTVNNGTLRLNTTNNGGSGTITANPGGTVVFGSIQTNAGIILAGGTFGASATQNPLVDDLTAVASTSSTFYIADPQNLSGTDAIEVAFSGTWHGSGNVTILSVTNDPGADSGNGFRLRGTAASDFSGTITVGNTVKAEVQTSVAGPFSPAGTGKFVLTCGVVTNNTVTGNFSELNLRNNFAGSTVFGNDVELAGSGIAVLDPLGSAPTASTVTMGNLKIGNGQELGVNVNGTTLPAIDHPVIFATVTLNGGTATFSPKTPGWNTVPQYGSDLSLGAVSELVAGSGFTMNGLLTLSLTGTSTYTGTTTVSNGTMTVSGALNGGGALIVAGGKLTGSGSTAGGLTVNSAGTIAPGGSPGKFTVGGAVTLQGTNEMEIDKLGVTNDVLQGSSIAYGGTLSIPVLSGTLAPGDSFKLYNASSYSGSFATIIPPTPGVDMVWDTNSLTLDGTLKVASATVPQPVITSVVRSGSDLIVSGTNGTPSGNYYVLSSTNVTLALTNWNSIATNSFTAGTFSFTNTIDPATPTRFYILQMP